MLIFLMLMIYYNYSISLKNLFCEVCGGIWWYVVWYVVVCGGMWQYVVVCGGMWRYVVVCAKKCHPSLALELSINDGNDLL